MGKPFHVSGKAQKMVSKHGQGKEKRPKGGPTNLWEGSGDPSLDIEGPLILNKTSSFRCCKIVMHCVSV